LTLRLTIDCHFASGKALARPEANSTSGIRYAYASIMPVPNLPSWTQNRGTSVSLACMRSSLNTNICMNKKSKEALKRLIIISIKVFKKIPALDRKNEHIVIKNGIASNEVFYKGFRSSLKFKEEIEKEKGFHELSKILNNETPQLFGYLTYSGVCIKLPEIDSFLFKICKFIVKEKNASKLKEKINRIYYEVEQILLTEKVDLEIIVLLNGLHIKNKNQIIDFNHNFRLKKLSDEELSSLLTIDYLFDQLKINPNFYSIIGITHKTETKLTFSINPIEDIQSYVLESLDKEIKKILESIHIVKKGSIQILGKFFKYSPDFIPNLNNLYYSSCQYQYLQVNVITESESEYIEKIYEELGKKGPNKLNIAIARLTDSENRLSPIDSLIDSIIGIESLINPTDTGEQTFKMSLYYAFLFEKEKRKENYNTLKSVFNTRNKIVHGGIGTNTSTDLFLLDQASDGKNILRKLIEKFLFDEKLKKQKKDYWIDLILSSDLEN